MTCVSYETKAQLRDRVRAARSARSAQARRDLAQAFARHGHALLPGASTAVAGYVGLPTEPDVGPLLASAHAAGHRVLVPRVEGATLVWVGWAPDVALTRGSFGIDEPVGPAVPDAFGRVGVLFLPALAVDRAGHRLGQGGGFYDRALAGLPAYVDGGPLRVACVFAEEVLDAVPCEPHDVTVDLALTPAGVVALG